jgi:hypothetical protein
MCSCSHKCCAALKRTLCTVHLFDYRKSEAYAALHNMYIDNDTSAGHASMGLQAMQAWSEGAVGHHA